MDLSEASDALSKIELGIKPVLSQIVLLRAT